MIPCPSVPDVLQSGGSSASVVDALCRLYQRAISVGCSPSIIASPSARDAVSRFYAGRHSSRRVASVAIRSRARPGVSITGS